MSDPGDTPEETLKRAAFQADADQIIERLKERGERVPNILYHWGRLMPNERDRQRAMRRISQPDVQEALKHLRP